MPISDVQQNEKLRIAEYLASRSVNTAPLINMMRTGEIQFCPSEKPENDELRFRTSTGTYLRHKPFDTNGSNYYKDKEKPCGVFCPDAAKQPVFTVTEGVYDALSLQTVGIPALALLGTGNTHFYDLLDKLPSRDCVVLLCLDNDTAGAAAATGSGTSWRRKGSERSTM